MTLARANQKFPNIRGLGSGVTVKIPLLRCITILGGMNKMKKPIVWKRFKWIASEKDGEVTIQPYDEFPSHVTCPRCGKDTDYNLWNKVGCIYCGLKEEGS